MDRILGTVGRFAADPVRLALSIAIIFGTAILLFAIDEEPYHVDELRQVLPYHLPVEEITRASIRQEQPPLNAWIGAFIQRVFGIGDVQQRAASVMSAIGSLILLGYLCVISGMRSGAVVTVALFASSPQIVNLSAYARPYALPIFLMLAFIVCCNHWLVNRTRLALMAALITGALLPSSRALTPLIFLGCVFVTAWLWRNSFGRDRRPVLAILAIAALAAGVVGVPYFIQLLPEISQFTRSSWSPLDGLHRLGTELPPILMQVFPGWPLSAALLLTAFALSESRHKLFAHWWWWALAAVPIIFAILFFTLTAPEQPYAKRYAFTFWVPLVVAVGVTVDAAGSRWKHGARLVPVGIACSVGLLLGFSAVQLAADLTSTKRPDWRRFSTVIEAKLPRNHQLLFDHLSRAGQWRSRFAGQPRYLPRTHRVTTVTWLARTGGRVLRNDGVAIAVLGPSSPVPGWNRVYVDRHFALYLPIVPVKEASKIVESLKAFADAHGDDRGAMMRLAAAAVQYRFGYAQPARLEVNLLLDRVEQDLSKRILRDIEKHDLEYLLRR